MSFEVVYTWVGTLVLFMQFITAADWRRQEELRSVSNVASADSTT